MRLNGAQTGLGKIFIVIAPRVIRQGLRQVAHGCYVAARGIITCLEGIRCVVPTASTPDLKRGIWLSVSGVLQILLVLNLHGINRLNILKQLNRSVDPDFLCNR